MVFEPQTTLVRTLTLAMQQTPRGVYICTCTRENTHDRGDMYTFTQKGKKKEKENSIQTWHQQKFVSSFNPPSLLYTPAALSLVLIVVSNKVEYSSHLCLPFPPCLPTRPSPHYSRYQSCDQKTTMTRVTTATTTTTTTTIASSPCPLLLLLVSHTHCISSYAH